MISRLLEKPLRNSFLKKNKAVVLYGPRRIGKTTILEKLYEEVSGEKEFLNCDFLDDQDRLQANRSSLNSLVSNLDYLFVDEAQNVEDIGTVLKLLHDNYPELKIIATGSSSFDLNKKLGEPLTGRKEQFLLYPISFAEQNPNVKNSKTIIEHSLVYGSYPEILNISNKEEKINYLKQLVADYLLRDLFRQADVNRTKLYNMLRLLALQVGSEVSLNEIATSVQLDVKTVAKYISYLEEAFVIVRLGGFSRNLRKEIAKTQKYYFFDLGIRNAIIQGFKPLSVRSDLGNIWENFLIIERIKKQSYARKHSQFYFWRTYDQKEIDLVEEQGPSLLAFEFKYSEQKKVKEPALWKKTYPEASFECVSPKNIFSFL